LGIIVISEAQNYPKQSKWNHILCSQLISKNPVVPNLIEFLVRMYI